MKIVSYNINTCTQKKIELLFRNDADVYVVPEIARGDKIKLPEGFDMEWVGDESFPSKGLGVIWKKGRGEVPKWYDKTLHYAIPVFVDDILILGIWPTKLDKNESECHQQKQELHNAKFYRTILELLPYPSSR